MKGVSLQLILKIFQKTLEALGWAGFWLFKCSKDVVW